MLYRNDYTGKKPAEIQSQQFTPAAGAFGSMYPIQQYNGAYQPMMQNGFSPMPVSAPAAGAITATGAALPASMPSIPSSMQGVMQFPTAVQPGNQVPSTVENAFFTPGFLRTQIGQKMRVEFLLGTNLLTDRTGTLVAVGASYILLRLIDSDDLMMCDIYSIKFVTIIK